MLIRRPRLLSAIAVLGMAIAIIVPLLDEETIDDAPTSALLPVAERVLGEQLGCSVIAFPRSLVNSSFCHLDTRERQSYQKMHLLYFTLLGLCTAGLVGVTFGVSLRRRWNETSPPANGQPASSKSSLDLAMQHSSRPGAYWLLKIVAAAGVLIVVYYSQCSTGDSYGCGRTELVRENMAILFVWLMIMA